MKRHICETTYLCNNDMKRHICEKSYVFCGGTCVRIICDIKHKRKKKQKNNENLKNAWGKMEQIRRMVFSVVERVWLTKTECFYTRKLMFWSFFSLYDSLKIYIILLSLFFLQLLLYSHKHLFWLTHWINE